MNKLPYKISKTVCELSAYTPGEQPQGGGWVKLNTNEFPYPPSPKVREAILAELGENGASLRLYPEPLSMKLRGAIAYVHGICPENVIIGNGSDDILNLIMRAFGDGDLKVAAMNPSYSLYPVLSKMQGAELVEIDFDEDYALPHEKIFTSGANVFILTSPNAPLGLGFDEAQIRKLAEGFNGLLVVDEAYATFAKFSAAGLVRDYKNLLVVETSSKGYALAGMRVGWALGDAGIIDILDRVRDSYNIDRLAQAAMLAALCDTEYYKEFRAKVVESRDWTEKFFDTLGWSYPKSHANFIFVKPKKDGLGGAEAAASLFQHLKDDKILVRFWPRDPKINDGLRVTVGTRDEMQKFKESVLRWTELQK
jgi:histidinol-phosphate aminotransferase